MTPSIDVLERLLVALLVGFLIGLDRERAELRKSHKLFAGVRTFPLIALVGALAMLLRATAGPLLLVVSFVAVAAVALISYMRSAAAGDVGATTEVAALATFLLGAVAGEGELLLAASVGIVVAVLLAAKPPLEQFSRTLTGEELAAALELAVISVIVLPLLPNRGYGPWEALNPFAIWLIVVLVSALSFGGFIAVRLLGEQRGLTLTAVLGALVSSTAVTMAMAGRARDDVRLGRLAAAATVLASCVMCLRVGVFAAVVRPSTLAALGPVIAAMTVTGGLAAWVLGARAKPPATDGTSTRLSNPFSLRAALTFGGLYAVVALAVRAGTEQFGAAGLYAVAALSALVEVDAIALAVLRAAPQLGGSTATGAIAIALGANTLVKLGLAVVGGRGRFRGYVAAGLGLVAASGLVATLAMLKYR